MQKIASKAAKYKIDILALQETRWDGAGRVDKKNFSMFYTVESTKSGQRGAGFVLNKRILKCFIGLNPINSAAKLKGRFTNICLSTKRRR